MRHLDSILLTRSLNRPCPFRARMIASRCSFRDSGIGDQILLQLAFPRFKIIRWNRLYGARSLSDGRDLLANQSHKDLGKRRRAPQ